MKIEIYINNKPMADYSPQELQIIKETLTARAFAAAGYEPLKKRIKKNERLLRNVSIPEAEGQKEKAVI